MGGLGGIMGGGGPMGMLKQVMQKGQQQGNEKCDQGGGGNDPAQMFQQILQQLMQGGGQGQG